MRESMGRDESGSEEQALRRWKPGVRWYHPAMAYAVIRLSRLIMGRMNRLEVEGGERFDALRERGGRGLLTFSNHVSMFDDPLLPCNLGLPQYSDVRWVAADALNFFGSPWKAWLFTAGKAVPIVRGAGVAQPGLQFLLERLKEGEWVHIFPEGKRTRKPVGLMADELKSGIGMLMAEALPIALPFYHYGMHEVLPVGSLRPRRGKRVRLVFGEPMDCAEMAEGQPRRRAPSLMTKAALEALQELERRVHPDAQKALEAA